MSFALRHLKLERPLAVLDLERTGADIAADRIVEVGVLKLVPGAGAIRYHRRVHPGIAIPAAAVAIHGITDDDVADRPQFRAIAPRLACLLGDADLAGFNIRRFDLPLLAAEFRRAGVAFPLGGRSVLDALQIYHRHEPRDLGAAARFYLGREHDGAHGALADAEATAAVLDAQIGRHEGLPASVAALHGLLTEVDIGGRFRKEGGRVAFAFGKHAGRFLEDVAMMDPGYLRWFLGRDFLEDAKEIVRAALEGPASW